MSASSPSESELIETIRRSLQPRIRARAEASQASSRPEGVPGRGPAGLDDSDLREDLDLLHRNHDLQQVRLHRHRPVLGGPILAVKRVLLRLLTPVLEQQSRFNASSTRLLQDLAQERARASVLEQRLEQLEQRLDLAERRAGVEERPLG